MSDSASDRPTGVMLHTPRSLLWPEQVNSGIGRKHGYVAGDVLAQNSMLCETE